MRLPRFTLRTLAIVVTLICAYFAAWEATKRYGVGPLPRPSGVVAIRAHSPMPLVIVEDQLDGPYDNLLVLVARANSFPPLSTGTRHYYLWLFGPQIKLPF